MSCGAEAVGALDRGAFDRMMACSALQRPRAADHAISSMDAAFIVRATVPAQFRDGSTCNDRAREPLV